MREIAEGRSAFRSLVAMSIKYEKAASGKGRFTYDVRRENGVGWGWLQSGFTLISMGVCVNLDPCTVGS